jgi:type II secretory pathway component PulJ
MTEDKMRRMVTGIVVSATALIATLLVVLVWQIVTMCVQNNRMAELSAEEARLEQLIGTGEKDLEFYESEAGKEALAFQQGFINPNGR